MSIKRDAIRIFRAGLAAADPYAAVLEAVKKLPPGRVWVVGAGKASARMAAAAEKALGKRIVGGWINTKDDHLANVRRSELHECSHPVPDKRGENGAREIAGIAQQAGKDDIVLALISGGASALMPLPADGITLDEKQATTRLLLECGATIHEMNCVRKHISGIKGGQLAALAYPARVVSLLLSDVIGDDLDVIGSGPTAPDLSTAKQARAVLEHYGIWDKVPEPVRQRIASGAETPKPDHPAFRRTKNVVIGSNAMAAKAAAKEARRLGYRTMVLSTFVDGETREIARMHAAILKEIRASGSPLRAPACVITGGETTVTIRGKGMGGRNQEFALAAALAIEGMEGCGVLSGGTDGTDGPTDAAGAFADGTTIARAKRKNLDAVETLRQHDSYPFFQALGDLLMTGPTGTNVMDLRILLTR
jgi:glycerate 2-kinase